MAHRDLKRSARPAVSRRHYSHRKEEKGSGIWLGLLLGLIIGVVSLGGVVWYLNRSTGFFPKIKAPPAVSGEEKTVTELLAPGTHLKRETTSDNVITRNGREASRPSVSSSPVVEGGTTSQNLGDEAAEKHEPRFDFYKILPGNTEALPTTESPAKPKQKPSDDPVVERFYLQLGAFQNQDEADNVKAKLALLGIEAKIQSAPLPGKGIVHRVRIGPFTNQEQANKLYAQLKMGGLDAILVKSDH